MKDRQQLNLTMLADFYEFTMANGFLEAGQGNREVCFDMFFRNVPDGGGFSIAVGLEQLIEYFTSPGSSSYITNSESIRSFSQRAKNFWNVKLKRSFIN